MCVSPVQTLRNPVNATFVYSPYLKKEKRTLGPGQGPNKPEHQSVDDVLAQLIFTLGQSGLQNERLQ